MTDQEVLEEISKEIKQCTLYLHQFEEVIEEAVVENGVGVKRMDKMVNGKSEPIRRQIIRNFRKSNLISKEELDKRQREEVVG